VVFLERVALWQSTEPLRKINPTVAPLCSAGKHFQLIEVHFINQRKGYIHTSLRQLHRADIEDGFLPLHLLCQFLWILSRNACNLIKDHLESTAFGVLNGVLKAGQQLEATNPVTLKRLSYPVCQAP